ncbi:embryonic testis differentiation protein homolog B-like [Nycticebus coucang]|uniref:embryonic testis differentiation protein homolog B-like n=1 Tax=Nycticebus coucang TaxID=9470 RepID=UPI00234DD6E0|nr:embryonic testis differentiation protein homolog B-like [Nycticebus coucang]
MDKEPINVTPKEPSDVAPKEPVLSIRRMSGKSCDRKHKQATRNVMHFLISRQLGKHRYDVDLAQWLWMLT